MTPVLALNKLYDDVEAQLTADGTAVTCYFGWREKERQRTGDRLIWEPGDSSDSAGRLVAARKPGRTPRPLATLEELCTVYVVATDETDKENQRAQYTAARLLYDAFVRALYLAGYGTVSLVSSTWELDRKIRQRGAAIRVVLSVDAMIPDEPLGSPYNRELAPADATHNLTLSVLDNDEPTPDLI
jgi:hypothetical protein